MIQKYRREPGRSPMLKAIAEDFAVVPYKCCIPQGGVCLCTRMVLKKISSKSLKPYTLEICANACSHATDSEQGLLDLAQRQPRTLSRQWKCPTFYATIVNSFTLYVLCYRLGANERHKCGKRPQSRFSRSHALLCALQCTTSRMQLIR